MILILFFLFLAAAFLAFLSYHASRWCLGRRLKFLVLLALAVLWAGTAYSLLRLTGVIILPTDHTWSIDFFDASWRDDGVRLLVLYGGPFTGTAAALARIRRENGISSSPQIEEKM